MNKKHQQELINLLLKASKDETLFKDLLNDLVTPVEYKELVLRWQIVKRLSQGEPQRAISKDLKVGIATVTRGSRALGNREGGFTKMIKKLKI